MSLDHICLWPGCTVPVGHDMWGCREHWYALPKSIRDRVWEEFRRAPQSPAHLAAIEAAVEWATSRQAEFDARRRAGRGVVPSSPGRPREGGG